MYIESQSMNESEGWIIRREGKGRMQYLDVMGNDGDVSEIQSGINFVHDIQRGWLIVVEGKDLPGREGRREECVCVCVCALIVDWEGLSSPCNCTHQSKGAQCLLPSRKVGDVLPTLLGRTNTVSLDRKEITSGAAIVLTIYHSRQQS